MMRTLRMVHNIGRTPARRPARHGFTLIEVMIALAIFMVGALAIVRIFPPALAAIQGSGSRSNGARLAAGALAAMNTRVNGSTPSRVADAIYFGNSAGVFETSFGGAFSGTSNRNQSLPRNARLAGNGNPANDSALTQPAYVEGENQRVLQDSGGNLFVLTNFAYKPGSLVLSREDVVEGVRVRDNDGTNRYIFDFSGATLASTGAAWSYSLANPQYPASAGLGADSTYYISYKWLAADGRMHGVVDEPYHFYEPGTQEPAGYTAPGAMRVALDTVLDSGTRAANDRPVAIVTGEVNVRLVRKLSPTNASGTDDELRGMYAFTLPGGSGISAGDTVRVSYQVNDWRSLIVDQAPANNAVTLTTRGLEESLYGDTVYALLYAAPNASGVSNNTVRRDSCIPGAGGACSGTGAIEAVAVTGNSTNRVAFRTSASGLGGLKAPRARIAYKPLDGWGVQAAVAARSYTPFLDFTAPGSYVRQPWREYSWKPGSANVYFQPGEAGKIVLMTYEYTDGTNYFQAKDRIVTISGDLLNVATAGVRTGFTGAGGKVAVAELTDLGGNPSPTVTAIFSVRGLSVQARAVWADNSGRYNQTVVTDYRKSS